MKLKPLNDQVILRLTEEEVRSGNIIIADTNDDKPVTAEVLALGKGVYNYHTDTLIPHQVAVGDIVLIPKMGVHKISYGNDEYYICQSQQLLAVINQE